MSVASSSTKFSSIECLAAAWASLEMVAPSMGRQAKERRRRFIDDAILHGIPSTRHEDWKFTSLRPLVERGFDLAAPRATVSLSGQEVLSAIKESLIPNALPIVFFDGQLITNLPGASLAEMKFAKEFSQAEKTEDAQWWDRWLPNLDSAKIFWKICLGLSNDGLVISIPKNQSDLQLLHIFHLSSGQYGETAVNNRILIDVDEGSSVRVVEEFLPLSTSESPHASWTNVLTQIRLATASHCGYYRVVNAPGAFHTGGVSVHLDRGSHLDAMSLVMAGRLVRVDFDVQHTATDSECNLNGLALMREADHVDHHTAVDHRVGQTRTNQFFKGILSDSARLVFNGKIFIRKQAQKSEAYQTCKNLLLSENAEANAKPQLEIDADDVKASHGAAIGTVNPQELFYLQSRCIEKSKAMAILCRGFADDVMFRLKDNQIREALAARVGRWFEGQTSHGKKAEGQ